MRYAKQIRFGDIRSLRLGNIRMKAGKLHKIFSCCRQLEQLEVRDCSRFKDSGLMLVGGYYQQTLRVLDVRNCTALTSKGLKALRRCCALDALLLDGCELVTDDAFDALCVPALSSASWSGKSKWRSLGRAKPRPPRVSVAAVGVDGASDATSSPLASSSSSSPSLERMSSKKQKKTLKRAGALGTSASLAPVPSMPSLASSVHASPMAPSPTPAGNVVVDDSRVVHSPAALGRATLLSVSHCYGLTPRAFANIGQYCSNLVSLEARFTKIDDLALLAIAGNCRSIARMNFRGSPRITDAGLAALGGCPALVGVVLRGCVKLTSQGLVGFSEGVASRTLRFINLCECEQVSNLGAQTLMRQCTEMTALNLRSTSVTDAVFAELDGQGVQLRYINVRGCIITDDAVAHLARAADLLRIAVFSETAISSDSLDLIRTGFPKLVRLDVRGVRLERAGLRLLHEQRRTMRVRRVLVTRAKEVERRAPDDSVAAPTAVASASSGQAVAQPKRRKRKENAKKRRKPSAQVAAIVVAAADSTDSLESESNTDSDSDDDDDSDGDDHNAKRRPSKRRIKDVEAEGWILRQHSKLDDDDVDDNDGDKVEKESDAKATSSSSKKKRSKK
jgi:Leucine Rich repeat